MTILNDAYSPRFPIFLALALPICIGMIIFRRPPADHGMGPTDKAINTRISAIGTRLMLCHVIVSPILMPVLVIEITIAILLLAVMGKPYTTLRNLLLNANSLRLRHHLSHA